MPDPHMQLCISEHTEPMPLPCQFCGNDSDGEWSDDDGWVCNPCIRRGIIGTDNK